MKKPHIQFWSSSFCWLILAGAAPTARGDDPLFWKMQPGERVRYAIVQEMDVTSGQPGLENHSRQQLDVTWEVVRVGEKGQAEIRLHFDRIRTKMTLPNGGLEYDSASPGPAIGMAAINAPLYQALVKSPLEFILRPDGRVVAVTIPEEVAAALKRMPTAANFGDLTRPETFQSLFLAGFPVLPEEASPSPGHRWSVPSAVSLPAAGTQTIETTYIYEGARETDGKTLAVIRPSRLVRFSNGGAAQRTARDQTSSGEIHFDRNAGRLESAEFKFSVTVDVAVGVALAEQKIEQLVQVRRLPPSE